MPAEELEARTSQHWPRSASASKQHAQHIGQILLVLSAVRLVYHAKPRYLLGPSRGGMRLSRARQIMHYLGHVSFGMSYTELGKLTHRDRTSVAHACQRVEDLRDDPSIDKGLFFMELSLNLMAKKTIYDVDEKQITPNRLQKLDQE
jgi:hypothetical protein